MKYLFLAYGAEDAWTDAERAECMAESLAVCDRLAAEGKYLTCAPLLPAATARTVRGDRMLVTDGPFAETTEHLGGFFLLDLADLDEAVAVAATLPPSWKGTIEVRPVRALPGVPDVSRGSALLGYDGAEPAGAILLHPADTATCVRVRGGSRVVTDGPFDAVAARLCSLAVGTEYAGPGAVEVRPLFDLTPVRSAR